MDQIYDGERGSCHRGKRERRKAVIGENGKKKLSEKMGKEIVEKGEEKALEKGSRQEGSVKGMKQKEGKKGI